MLAVCRRQALCKEEEKHSDGLRSGVWQKSVKTHLKPRRKAGLLQPAQDCSRAWRREEFIAAATHSELPLLLHKLSKSPYTPEFRMAASLRQTTTVLQLLGTSANVGCANWPHPMDLLAQPPRKSIYQLQHNLAVARPPNKSMKDRLHTTRIQSVRGKELERGKGTTTTGYVQSYVTIAQGGTSKPSLATIPIGPLWPHATSLPSPGKQGQLYRHGWLRAARPTPTKAALACGVPLRGTRT
jgi:hypothetical protein